MESKTNIALGVKYRDERTKLKYRTMEFLDNYKKVRCQNSSKVTVIFCVKIAEKYFTEL